MMDDIIQHQLIHLFGMFTDLFSGNKQNTQSKPLIVLSSSENIQFYTYLYCIVHCQLKNTNVLYSNLHYCTSSYRSGHNSHAAVLEKALTIESCSGRCICVGTLTINKSDLLLMVFWTGYGIYTCYL